MPSPNARPGDIIGCRQPPFHSTVSIQKIRRINSILLLLRLLSFCFTLASSIFVSTSTSWLDSDSFRLVFAANAIVAVYSLFQTSASVHEIVRESTLLPELLQLWFDFAHDQVLGYLMVAAEAAGMGEAVRKRREIDTCTVDNNFCIQVYIAVALGFVGFIFLAISTVVSAFRLAFFLLSGSRFPHVY
ncbi:CASP-like protein [Zostera marina]|uniref:CASP-like protein n=1 Tax=Zostera marina TaxID=29655 RepID=A0A0K9P1C0_ZOSMR|nr:CASP-like protein [Zostera marina]